MIIYPGAIMIVDRETASIMQRQYITIFKPSSFRKYEKLHSNLFMKNKFIGFWIIIFYKKAVFVRNLKSFKIWKFSR